MMNENFEILRLHCVLSYNHAGLCNSTTILIRKIKDDPSLLC